MDFFVLINSFTVKNKKNPYKNIVKLLVYEFPLKKPNTKPP